MDSMNYKRCIICQKAKSDDLRCPASDKNALVVVEAYQTFLDDWERFRIAGISVDVKLPIPDATVEFLKSNLAKWHKSCRRQLRSDKLERQSGRKTENTMPQHTTRSSTSLGGATSRSMERKVGLKIEDRCLFCKEPGVKRRALHSFQKLELTEDIRKKALLINDSNILKELSVGDVVSNELKYHASCYTIFNRQYETVLTNTDEHENMASHAASKILEEILGLVEEDLAAGRRYFTLKALYEEMSRRAELHDTPLMNRTRLKNAILQRFSPMLKEEEGFRNEVVLVRSQAMKDLVQSSLVSTAPSEDFRILSKAALICRREMSKQDSFDFIRDGFSQDCQKKFVPDALKFLVGLIMHGPSHDSDFENEQSTLSITQLINFNAAAKNRRRQETPLPIYLGLLIHSKFRNSCIIDELNRLGISVSYNRVKYLERKMGHTVLGQFTVENLVCPTEMRTGLFTVAAVDNIDHNPSARTSKDSFHGTAISLFQVRQNQDDGSKRNVIITSKAPGKMKLADDFTELPEITAKSLHTGPQSLETTTINIEHDLLLRETNKEAEWAKSVIPQVTDHLDRLDSDAASTWSAYHGRCLSEGIPCVSGLFPLFNESSDDPRMILHAMHITQKSVKHLNPNQVPVITGDQPVYAIMKKLQWGHEYLKGMVIILGGFHTEKHSAKAIGDILQGSGWTESLAEAGIASPGTADGILNAVYVTKARYAHQVTFVTLQMLLHEAHQQSATELSLDEWIKRNCEFPTFAYWIIVMKFEAVLLTFVRAHREGNFDLYVESLRCLGELFFACDHYHYARWVPVHVEDMKRLPQSVLDEFRKGSFSVKRSKNRFSAIAIDQSHEQMNKKLKENGGIIGLTQDSVSLLNWSICRPEVSKRLEDFLIASEAEDDDDCDFFHHDEALRRQEDFLSDVTSLSDIIREHGSPFLELGNELINLNGQISEDKASVSLIEKAGKQQYETYVNDILIGRTKSFDIAIKKNNFLLFKAPKHRQRKSQKLGTVRANASILGRRFIATQSRQGNLDEFFAHETQEFPPSMAESAEKMYHSKKSDVLVCFEKEMNETQSDNGSIQFPTDYDAVVLDGGALIHSLIPRTGATNFSNYFETCFLKQVEMELRKTHRLDIVWDCYFETSIKGETRDERGQGVRLKIGPKVLLPKNWSSFLRVPANKVELFSYLTEAVISNMQLPQCDLYITDGDIVRHVGPGNSMMDKCDHEEADTRIVLHVLHALSEGAKTVLVRTVDSDVVVILVHQYERFMANSKDCEICINFGTGKNKRIINIS